MTATDSKPPKQDRLAARLTTKQKELIQHAAALSGLSVTDFVVRSAQEAAEKVIRNHEVITLTAQDSAAFAEALLHPPAPNDALIAALRGARELVLQRHIMLESSPSTVVTAPGVGLAFAAPA